MSILLKCMNQLTVQNKSRLKNNENKKTNKQTKDKMPKSHWPDAFDKQNLATVPTSEPHTPSITESCPLLAQVMNHKQIDYGFYFDKTKNYSTRFTTSPHGFILIACTCAYSNSKSKLCIYNHNGNLMCKTDVNRRLVSIGMSNDMIYTAPCSYDNKLEIQVMDYGMVKQKVHINAHADKIDHVYPIDAHDDRCTARSKPSSRPASTPTWSSCSTRISTKSTRSTSRTPPGCGI